MIGTHREHRVRLAGLVLLGSATFAISEPFRVATYNIENYLDHATESRPAKPEVARAKVRDNILALKPDVLALQEVGTFEALRGLQADLRGHGLDLPHVEWVTGWDTNIHVAVLSRFPFARRSSRTNEVYLLNGRRLHVSRGIADVSVQVTPGYAFTRLSAHLKSKRRVAVADESEMRLEEARVLRRLVDAHLAREPDVNLLVCGDLNDFYNSPPVRTVVGRGRRALTDTRPTERNGDTDTAPAQSGRRSRTVTWTHYYGAEDTYSRIDYMLVSRGMAAEWLPGQTHLQTVADWGLASDHRALVASFEAADR